jgi:type II secretory pathway component GspD/PulD (secretin)
MIQLVSGESVLVPLAVEPPAENVDLAGEHGLVTLVATGAELKSVLRMIADHHGLNLVLGPEVGGPVTVSIRGARLEEVLDAILGVAGFAWHRVDNLLYVTGVSAAGMDPRVQGRVLQVYPLDYVAATDVEPVANGLLSPVGSVYVSQADSADQLRTREILVVEDTASAHARIAQYISQIDIPPRQVLVEAHVLQVALSEEERHGIDLRGLARLDGSSITLEGSGFTDTESGGKAVTLRFDGRDMQSLIELIRQQSNSRTLASPKLSVVNHQEAKIQIGQRLPYSVSTTTQTTTVESVEFLEVGIVLTVRPVITNDGHVLMNVFPKVSGGKITDNGFPEEDTTEVQTTILMPDGGGVIIGGLIREENIQNRAMVPFFGRIPVLGHLFRRRSDELRRNELIVALVTHVMPDTCSPRMHEMMELEQTLPDYAACELLQNQVPVIHDEAAIIQYEYSDH